MNPWAFGSSAEAPTSIMIALMTLAGRYGTDVQAGYTIGVRVESLPVFLALPVANACATLVGQNLGAGRPARAWRAIRVAYAIEGVAMLGFAVALFLARGWVVAQFTQDPEVSAVASEYLVFAFESYAVGSTPFFTHLCSRTSPLADNPYVPLLGPPLLPTGASPTTWGAIKLLYR